MYVACRHGIRCGGMLQLDLGCFALRLCLIYRLHESGRIDTGSDRRLKPAHSSFGIVETLLRGVPAAINALGSCKAGDGHSARIEELLRRSSD
jgi:hypothetical protein